MDNGNESDAKVLIIFHPEKQAFNDDESGRNFYTTLAGLKMNSFTKNLLRWHERNRRDLPWKKTKDPYKIWLSEIILQQTRVEQGLPYYESMVKQFPTVKQLANAHEDQVMRAWQGLGYYTRARNLHFAARQVMNESSGRFPSTYHDIRQLKGVGDYTAAAIASFAFDLPHAVVDGNVLRVLSRAFGIREEIKSAGAKRKASRLAHDLLDPGRPAAFNQAIMDFGATVCTPANPLCNTCFFKRECYAFKRKVVNKLPVNSKSGRIRMRYFNYLVLQDSGKLIIEKRMANDIWNGLYQFPLVETSASVAGKKGFLKEIAHKKLLPVNLLKITGESSEIRHQLSHQTIMARFITAKTSFRKIKMKPGWQVVTREEIKNFPFPKPIENFITKIVIFVS